MRRSRRPSRRSSRTPGPGCRARPIAASPSWRSSFARRPRSAFRAGGEKAREQAEAQFHEQIKTLRSQLDEERSSREQVTQKSEQRAQQAAAQAKDVETARLDAEAEARTAAAEWVRGQTQTLRREAERGAKEQVAELTAELEETRRALNAAEGKLGKAPEPGPDQAKNESAEQGSMEATEPKPGFLQRRAEARRARRAEKAAEGERREAEARKEAEEKEAAEKKAAREREAEAKKADAEAAPQRREAAPEKKPEATGNAKSPAGNTASRAKRSSDSESSKPKPAKARRRGGPLDVNKATFEEFREVGMSVTQATRVIAYRERQDGFDSVDDLDTVPGMSRKLMTEIRDKLTT